MKQSEFKQWVKEKQLILDRLLEDNSPEYIPIRMKLTKEYERLEKEIEDEVL
jgi:hypothetical protein